MNKIKQLKKASKKEIAKTEINQKLAKFSGGFNDLGTFIRLGAWFDAQKQRRRKPKRYKIKIVDENFGIIIKRDENTIQHQRVFEALMEIGELKPDGVLVIKNLYEVKKLAGINTDTSDIEIVNIIKEIADVSVELLQESEDQKYTSYLTFHLLGNITGIIDNTTNRSKSLMIVLDKGFIKAVQYFIKVKIDRKLMQYIHNNVQSAYTEKLIKFFLTQQKNLVFKKTAFWSLIKIIADFPIPNRDKQILEYKTDKVTDRYKRMILAEIDKEADLLKEFGIEFERKEQKITFNYENNTHRKGIIIAYPNV